MGSRSKTLINSFSAAFKRLLKAIETHGHPDLADKTHRHEEIANVGLLYDKYNLVSDKNNRRTLPVLTDIIYAVKSYLFNPKIQGEQCALYGPNNKGIMTGLTLPSPTTVGKRKFFFNPKISKYVTYSYGTTVAYINNSIDPTITSQGPRIWIEKNSSKSTDVFVKSAYNSVNNPADGYPSLSNFTSSSNPNTSSYFFCSYNNHYGMSRAKNPDYSDNWWIEEFRVNPGFVYGGRRLLFANFMYYDIYGDVKNTLTGLTLSIYGNSSSMSSAHRNSLCFTFDHKASNGTVTRYEVMFKKTKTLFNDNNIYTASKTALKNVFARLVLAYNDGRFELYIDPTVEPTDTTNTFLTLGSSSSLGEVGDTYDNVYRVLKCTHNGKKWSGWSTVSLTGFGTNGGFADLQTLITGSTDPINLNFKLFTENTSTLYRFNERMYGMIGSFNSNLSLYKPGLPYTGNRAYTTQGAFQEMAFTRFDNQTDFNNYFNAMDDNNDILDVIPGDSGSPIYTGDLIVGTSPSSPSIFNAFNGIENKYLLSVESDLYHYDFLTKNLEAYIQVVDNDKGTLSDELPVELTNYRISPNKLSVNTFSETKGQRTSFSIDYYKTVPIDIDDSGDVFSLQDNFDGRWNYLCQSELLETVSDSTNNITTWNGSEPPLLSSGSSSVGALVNITKDPRPAGYKNTFTLVLTGKIDPLVTADFDGGIGTVAHRPILSCMTLEDNKMNGIALCVSSTGVISLRKSSTGDAVTTGIEGATLNLTGLINNYDGKYDVVTSKCLIANNLTGAVTTYSKYFYIELIFTTKTNGSRRVKIRTISSDNLSDFEENSSSAFMVNSEVDIDEIDSPLTIGDNWAYVLGGTVTALPSSAGTAGLSIKNNKIHYNSFIEYPYDIDIIRNFYRGDNPKIYNLGLPKDEIDFIINRLPSIEAGSVGHHNDNLFVDSETIIPALLGTFDHYIDTYHRKIMNRQGVKELLIDETNNTFERIRSVNFFEGKPVVEIGNISSDDAGIVSGNLYALQEKYTSDWLAIDTTNNTVVVNHFLGYKNITVEVQVSSSPTGADNIQIVKGGAGGYGINVTDVTNYALTLKAGGTSIVNNNGPAVTSGYVRVIVKRQF